MVFRAQWGDINQKASGRDERLLSKGCEGKQQFAGKADSYMQVYPGRPP